MSAAGTRRAGGAAPAPLRLLLGLRGRQARAELRYWGRVLGLLGQEGDLARGFAGVYRLYVLLLLAAWLVLAWEALLSAAAEAHATLPPLLRSVLADLVPGLVFLGQLALLGMALVRSPIPMRAADLALLATSPVSRRAWLAVDFARTLLQRGALAAPAGAALAVLLTGDYAAAWAGTAGALLLLLFAEALAWAAGLARLATARRAVHAGLWLVPAAALASAFAPGPGVRWPGLLFLRAVGAAHGTAAAGGGALAILALLDLAGVALLLAAAGAMDIRLAAEAAAVDLEAGDMRALRWLDPAVAQRWRRRLALRSARPRGRLPAARGWWALPARVGIGWLRQPGRLLGLLAAGGWLLGATGLVMRPEARGAWLAWLLLWLVRPPRAVVDGLEEAQEPFLRGLVPLRPAALLAGGLLLPALVLALLGAPLAALLGAAAGALLSLLLYWALLLLAALSQGLGVLGSELGGWAGRAQAELLAGLLGFGAVLLLGAQAGSLSGALLAALLADLLLAALWWRAGGRTGPGAADRGEGG
ncbi:MAG: hypothetical protein K6U79_09085 [Firmicutes bacterium]|nr:hypothetical protein [Bacillota bacterium]